MIRALEEFDLYNRAMRLGEEVSKIVQDWNKMNLWTTGIQVVRSADSIAANLAEGLGRYHLKEIRNFAFYSRGSIFETKCWLAKAFQRGLIDKSTFEKLNEELNVIGKMLNNYIKSLGNFGDSQSSSSP